MRGLGGHPILQEGEVTLVYITMRQHSLLMSMRKVTLYTLHIRLYSIPSPALFLLGDFQSLLQFMPIILLKGPLILHSLSSLLERRPFFQPRQVGNFVQVSAVRGQHDCRRSPAAV